jgi:hypothetical protein
LIDWLFARCWLFKDLYTRTASSKTLFEFVALTSAETGQEQSDSPAKHRCDLDDDTSHSPPSRFVSCSRGASPLLLHSNKQPHAATHPLAIDDPDSMIQILTTTGISRRMESALRLSELWQPEISETAMICDEIASISALLEQAQERIANVTSTITKHSDKLRDKQAKLGRVQEYVVAHIRLLCRSMQRSANRSSNCNDNRS